MPCPRVIVFGYNDVGYECLEALLAAKVNVVAVFTHEDKHESENIWFRSVKDLAVANHIPVYTPQNPNTSENLQLIRSLAPDLIFSFYYRAILGKEILSLPKLGAYNMHGSLLPKYRGRVSINWAIINGENETGATLHQMVEKVDAGDIVDQQAVEILTYETAKDVFEKVTRAARHVLERNLPTLLDGSVIPIPQDETQASYFGGRTAEDGRINWKLGARQIVNLVRATTHPYPGAFTTYKNKRLIIWEARELKGHSGRIGEVVSKQPLIVATGNGHIELVRYDWQDREIANDADYELKPGTYLKYADE